MREKYFCRSGIVFLFVFAFNTTFFSQSKTKYDASEGFVAHEWGTFTTLSRSNGELLCGLELEEEHLPSFVWDLCFCPILRTYTPSSTKGFTGISVVGNPTVMTSKLENVTVKMETPVLYFYSPEKTEKDITVNVRFVNGSISQWYPSRTSGEIAESIALTTSTPNMASTGAILSALKMDFAQPRTGFIWWNATVLPLNTASMYTNDPKLETPTWVSPRATQSNLLRTPDGQVEKFLFYRGIGNFEQPLKVEFNTQHHLVITNKNKSDLNYVMVYEKKSDGTSLVWWSGTLGGAKKRVVVQPQERKIGTGDELENFVKHLVDAGLYEDEARAMLKTWEKSYFEHEGLKVFWIVPTAFTDKTLPLTITPGPAILKRVLVGRSEILTPEFEKELYELSGPSFDARFKDDRFFIAYKYAMGPTTLTDYDVLEKDDAIESTLKSLEVFPNPTFGKLTVRIDAAATIKIFSYDGSLVQLMQNAGAGEYHFSIESLKEGIYIVKAEANDGKFITKKVIKR